MQAMLATLVNLLEGLDQIVVEDARPVLKVLKDLLVKLSGDGREVWFKELKKFLRRETCWVMTPLQRLIKDSKYDYVDANITDEIFPVPEDFVLGADPKIFHFDQSLSIEAVIKKMDEEGYRPAMIWDLLEYGAKNPDEQRMYPIVGLGHVDLVRGVCHVLILGRVGYARGLYYLPRLGDGWRLDSRFLAVRK